MESSSGQAKKGMASLADFGEWEMSRSTATSRNAAGAPAGPRMSAATTSTDSPASMRLCPQASNAINAEVTIDERLPSRDQLYERIQGNVRSPVGNLMIIASWPYSRPPEK